MPEPTHRSRRRLREALTAAAAVLVLAGCGAEEPSEGVASGVVVHDDDGLHGALLDDPYRVPPATLTATDGSDYALPDGLEHPLTLVFFGYTQCPDICQIIMADITSALTRLEPDIAEQVGMLLVTSDPARDDPATLRAYLDRFNRAFEGLTGPLPEIVRVGAGLKVPVEKGDRLPSGGYAVVHGTAVIGLRPDGTAPVVWPEGIAPAELAEDLDRLLSGDVPGLEA